MKKQIFVTTIKLITAVLFIAAVTYIAYLMTMQEKVTYAATVEDRTYQIVDNTKIDINEIVQKNTQPVRKEEIIKKEKDIEYNTKYKNNSELPKGIIHVIQEGSEGKQEIVIKKIYENDKLIKEEEIANKVAKAAINKIVEVGTGRYKDNYKPQKGDKLYVTTLYLAVRISPKEDAEKLITINKNSEVKLLQQKDKWYQVKYESYIGWAKSECFTHLDPNKKQEEQEIIPNNKYTKQELLNTLSFDMALNKPSGLSLEQFKKVFKNEKRDTEKIFENNAQYFYYAEQQYNVNGIFIAAVAIHESGWGGSSIASDKKNLFGYGAYDSDPYNKAYEFSNYSEGIDLLARVFAKYYLNPKGTKIYDGNIADGCYYNGNTVKGVNKKYATDKKWANGVYSWMEYLYENL